MVDRPELQTLLEVSVSIGRSAATGDLDLILRRTLPLLVRRSASAAGAIVSADGDHLETLAVTPRSLRDRPEWATILRHLLTARGSDDAWVVRSGGLVHHGVALTGYGLLVLSRRRALPADFVQALLPVLEVLAAVLRAQRDRERSRTATAKLRALDTRQRAQHAALSRLSARFVGEIPFAQAVDRALADLGEAYGAGRATVFLIDEQAGTFASAYEWCAPGVASLRTELRDIPLDAVGLLTEGMRRGEPVHLPDVSALDAEHGAERHLFERFGIRSLVSAPLHVQGRLVGSLGLDRTHLEQPWQLEDLTLLTAAAELLGGAMASEQAGQQLVRAREAAEQASAAKSRFLSTISHELRTPMNGVLGMTELLLDAPLEPPYRGYLESARTAARSLLGLLDELLDQARIERGAMQLTPEPTDLVALLTGAVDVLRAGHDAAGPDLVLQLDPRLPSPVLLDGDRLRQVVGNLVSNALRHTRAGRVLVAARMPEPADGDGPVLRLQVTDTGSGIPEAEQDRVFEPFVQLGPVGVRTTVGTGLGLAIVREIVTLMDGRIHLESTVGVGTTITVDLPLHPLTPDRPELDEAVSVDERLAVPLQVLVAEDNLVNQEVIRSFLDDLGWRVQVVDDGQAAIEAFGCDRYDLVLMDCYMPGLDGLAATRALRATPRGRRVPIIAVTADASEAQAEQCRLAGMDALLTKPFERASLLRTVADAVDRYATPAPAVGT